jgi:hypothetical protein
MKNSIKFNRGPDKKPRKPRSDRGRKRKVEAGEAVDRAVKYGVGLYAGSKIWNQGKKLGDKIGEKTVDRVAKKAHPNSLVGKGKTAAKYAIGIAAADLAVKGSNALTREARKRFEERRRKKGKS